MEETTDVNEEVEQVTTPTESSPEATKEPEVESEVIDEDDSKALQEKADKEIAEDLEDQDKKEESDETEEESKEEPEEAEEVKEPETPKKGAEARKAELQTDIRKLVAQRNELRDEVTRANAQVYEPQSAEQLIEQGYDPAIARVEALEQRTQMAEYNAQVTDLNANINIEALQVMADYPVFDPDSDQYDSTLANRARDVFEKSAQVQVDPNTGLIVQANVLPYDIYKAFAETKSTGAQQGKVNGQKAAEKMLSSAEPQSSAAPKQEKVDPFLKGLTG